MSENTAPSRRHWETFRYRGRSFFRIPLRTHRHGVAAFGVACRIGGRYEVQGVLSRGGGGVILVALDHATGNPVLVKALAEYKTELLERADSVDVFVESLRRARHHLQTERRILVQLHRRGSSAVPHPNDYVYDANPLLAGAQPSANGEPVRGVEPELAESEPYLVMQRVQGTGLNHLLRNQYRRGVDPRLALRIVDQVARVLELLEQPFEMNNGQTWRLVYQDLKPGNILLEARGRATLLDFGGCQLVIDDTLVLHGSHTPGYCAPECGLTDEGIDTAADTYALGSTLFHMLSGVDPRTLLAEDLGPQDPRASHIDAQALAGRCSPELVALVARSVAWDLDARFQTVGEFRGALAPFLEQSCDW